MNSRDPFTIPLYCTGERREEKIHGYQDTRLSSFKYRKFQNTYMCRCIYKHMYLYIYVYLCIRALMYLYVYTKGLL